MMDKNFSVNPENEKLLRPSIAWRILVVLIAGLIIFFTINPDYPLKQNLAQIPYSDTMVHLFSFGVLMYCCCQAWKQSHIRIILGAILVVLGVGLEILQAKLVGGHFEFMDNLANTLGVALGYLFGNLQKHMNRI